MKFCQGCKVSASDETVSCATCGEACWSVSTSTPTEPDEGSGEPETDSEPTKPPVPRRRR